MNVKVLHLDIDAIIDEIMDMVEEELRIAEEDFLQEFRQNVMIGAGSEFPTSWGNKLRRDVKHISDARGEQFVSKTFGLDYDENPDNWEWMRAMVVAYGMGLSSALSPHSITSYKGKIVWNSSLTAKKESKVDATPDNPREIPPSWYHGGNNAFDDAWNTLKAKWEDYQDAVANKISMDVITRHAKLI